MQASNSSTYWSVSRETDRHTDGIRAIKTAAALDEIQNAIRDAFPAASEVKASAESSGFLVQFATGQKPVSVRFGSETLEGYRRCADAARHQALKTLRLVCNFAFAREYVAHDDPNNPFVIDARMALSNTLT